MNTTTSTILQQCSTINFSSKETFLYGLVTGIIVAIVLFIIFKIFTRDRSDP
jgi:hypothetical protein